MNLYERMQNITGIDIEEKLTLAIQKTNDELNGLLYERTCKIYNGTLYSYLREKRVLARLVNTKDFGQAYEHVFVLLPSLVMGGGYLLADLTYSQFPNKDEVVFKELLEKGYQMINEWEFYVYLKSIKSGIISLNRCCYLNDGRKI